MKTELTDDELAEMQVVQKRWEEERLQKQRERDKRRHRVRTPEYRAAEYQRRKENDPEAVKLSGYKGLIKQRYGMTLEEYDQRLKDQGGCCKLCGTDKPRGRGRFEVDHDHKTGEIRGLLCHKCNMTVGNHSAEFLLRCAAYVASGGNIK